MKLLSILFCFLPLLGISQIKSPSTFTTPNLYLYRVMDYEKAKPYRPFAKEKIIANAFLTIPALADGLVEGYEFDGRKSWERKLGVDPYSYGGSLSWTEIYINNDPSQGEKSKFRTWLGANDFYHHMDDTRKIGYISGGFLLGRASAKHNNKLWQDLADLAITNIWTGFIKSRGLHYIRH